MFSGFLTSPKIFFVFWHHNADDEAPSTMIILRLLLVATAACCTSAFVAPTTPNRKPSLVTRQALWRHFVPRNDHPNVWDSEELLANVKIGFLGTCLALVLALPAASLAVSGGGLDFANLDITGQDFSNKSYKGKDFTQVRNAKVVVSTRLIVSHTFSLYIGYCQGNKLCQVQPARMPFLQGLLGERCRGSCVFLARCSFQKAHEHHVNCISSPILLLRLMLTFPMPTYAVLLWRILAWMELRSRIQMRLAPILVRVCWMSVV